MSGDFASDYIDVATRIAAIKGDADREYPNGTFQPADLAQPFHVVTIDGATFIAYVAAFYRDPDDTRPGIGSAWEPVPGRTPFTRGSELQNAETSAWGRALVAALAADTKKGIASADDVRNQREAMAQPPQITTDFAWLEDARRRLTLAANATEVDALVAEARKVLRDGRLTTEDAGTFKAETDQRLAELRGPVGVTA